MLGIFKNLFAAGDNTKLKEIIEAGAVLIDVRSPGEFASGHIKGSVNIPLDRIGSQLQVLKKDKPICCFLQEWQQEQSRKSNTGAKRF